VERLYRGGSNTVGKEHFTSLYGPARERALSPKNIQAGWMKAGLFPFNPDRVLKDIQRPPAELTVPKTNDIRVRSCLQSEILHTPVTAEDVTALCSLINQTADNLDETSKRRLQKLANAATTSLAECALLHDENKLLFKQNDEAKRRQTAKSTVVGKAKVMSYEDIEVAKSKRAAKEAAKDGAAAKGKRGRKRKSPTNDIAKAKKARSEVEIAKVDIAATGMGDYYSVFQL
jgi:hypothetical protein